MRAARSEFCLCAAFLAVFTLIGSQVMSMQSLADVARKEAERRKLLEEQGIEGKVIEEDAARLASDGSLTLSMPSASPPKNLSRRPVSQKNQPSLRTFRARLETLDRSIQKDEERVRLLQARIKAERWAPPKAGRVSRRANSADSQSRLQQQIEELQIKLKHLRQERSETYDAGKKAGFLPGELEGKGIVP
jgi:hypothetical protein